MRKPKKIILICIFIIIYIILLFCQGPKYYFFYPTIKLYPNNKEDLKIVKKYTENRNKYYINLFYLTDESVSNAFVKIINKSKDELEYILKEQNFYILLLKIIFNRGRPKQIDPNLDVLKSNTADTPAYPSGHAFQAYYLAKVLSIEFKDKVKQLWDLAEDCALARVYAGLHYKSDNEFSKKLVIKYF